MIPLLHRCSAPRPDRRLPTVLPAVLGVLLLAVTACQTTPPDTAPMTINDTITPTDLQNFLDNDLTISDHGDFGLDQAQLITTTDAPGGTMLRISYPAGSASRTADGPDGGTQAYLNLPNHPANPTDTLDLQYQLRFPPDFDFVKGGKLPGLYGGTVTSGKNIPDGTDGFSTRYMWRTNGDGEVYAYLPTSQQHGTSLGRGCWTFTPGQWTTIRQRVQLNTPGHNNGHITVWQDNHLVLDQTGLEFRTTDELHIDGLFFSTFFGGDDTTWASPTDQYTDFAQFTLSTSPSPPPARTTLLGSASDECETAGGS